MPNEATTTITATPIKSPHGLSKSKSHYPRPIPHISFDHSNLNFRSNFGLPSIRYKQIYIPCLSPPLPPSSPWLEQSS